MRSRVLIIVNPTAGRPRRSRRRLARVVAALERGGAAVVVRPTDSATGDAERLAREAEPEFALIVAAGGDGTLNAVINGLAGTPRPLALLPLGTANVAARAIRLPRDPERLATLYRCGPALPVWPGRVGDRLFLTMASSGFDAETVRLVDSHWKRRLGRLAFAGAILRHLWRYRPCDIRIRVGGTERRAATVVAAKSRCYAGSYVIAPEADLATPALDLVLFQSAGRRAVLCYLGALLAGRLARRPDVTVLRCRSARVSAATPVPVQADGELVGGLPITLGVAEQPLYLVQPAR